jgi:RNA polymerase sigma-70 factor (ECF subfamily)
MRAWLSTILHDQYVNGVRKAAREMSISTIDEVTETLATRESQFSALTLRDLNRALAMVSDEQREAILRISLEGLSYDEAAKILDVSVGTVRSRLSRGRKTLRDLMDAGETPRSFLADGKNRPSRLGSASIIYH